MMSLFSSFDLKMFNLAVASLMLFLFWMSLSFYKISFKNFFYSKIVSVSESYFFSVNSQFFILTSQIFFSLMIFIFSLNFLSILPFNFSFSSQMSAILMLGGSLWMASMIISFYYNIKGSLMHFIPEGSPLAISWFLFLVELISNIIRPLTVSIRLVANILAGHLLITLLSNLVFMFSLSLSLFFVLNILEIFVSMIQSYIFVTMMKLYYAEI